MHWWCWYLKWLCWNYYFVCLSHIFISHKLCNIPNAIRNIRIPVDSYQELVRQQIIVDNPTFQHVRKRTKEPKPDASLNIWLWRKGADLFRYVMNYNFVTLIIDQHMTANLKHQRFLNRHRKQQTNTNFKMSHRDAWAMLSLLKCPLRSPESSRTSVSKQHRHRSE